jgi:hypothetical protein
MAQGSVGGGSQRTRLLGLKSAGRYGCSRARCRLKSRDPLGYAAHLGWRITSACGNALLFLNRNCARYQSAFLGADRPYEVTLRAVRVDDLVRFDRSNQGAACVRMLQPLLPASRAARYKNKGVFHEANPWRRISEGAATRNSCGMP